MSLAHVLNRFRWFRKGRPALGPSNKLRWTPVFETLEERTVPSILFSNTGARTIVDSGGPILSRMQVDLIFWGSGWNTGGGPALRSGVQNSATAILNSTYFDGLIQYRGIGHGALLRSDTITTTNPPASFTTAPGGDVSTFVGNNINNNTLPSPNGQILYFVVPQSGSTPSDCNGCGGRHLAAFASGNRVFPYGLTSNPANVSLDTLSTIMSHEFAEAASNPEWNIPNQAAFHVPNAVGDEIGDGEPNTANNTGYLYRVNGALVQAYLSQRDHAYIVTNGSTNNFLVSSGLGINPRVLTFQESFGGNNAIEINRIGNGVAAELNFSTAQFEPGSIRGITVNALPGDGIAIDQTGADAPVTVNLGGGSEGVGISTGLNNLGAIQGSISINGGSGSQGVHLYDSAATGNLTYTITDSGVTRPGVAPITFSGQASNSVDLRGGLRGANVYRVTNTEPRSTTSVATGDGNDEVDVERTTGALTVNLGSGTNTVNVSPTAHNLDAIAAGITVHGGSGNAMLNINDQGKVFGDPLHPVPGVYTLTATSAQRNGAAVISYSGINQFRLSTGQAFLPIQVSITSTASGTQTSVTAQVSFAPNFVFVGDAGNTLDGIQGPLSVASAGFTVLTVADQGKVFGDPSHPVPGVYTLTATSAQRNGAAAINFSGINQFNLSTGFAFLPIQIAVTSTASGTQTLVTARSSSAPNFITLGDAGNTLDGLQGALSIAGASFSLLVLNDQGTGTGRTFTVTADTIAPSRTAPISYQNMLQVVLNGGNGGNTFNVQSTPAATPWVINTGPASDTVNLTNASNTLDGIGNVSVNDASGTATVTVDDSGFGGNDDYTIIDPTVSVARLANFSLTYSGIAALNLNTGPGSDTFNIDSTSVATTVNAGAGGNVFHISPFSQYLAASILGPLTLNGGGADILDFFDANDPNAETFSFDPAPSGLTLGSTGTTIASLSGMGGGIYVVTNGFSTPDDQSGTVTFDPAGGPPAIAGGDTRGAASTSDFVPEALPAWFWAATAPPATKGASAATHPLGTASPGRVAPVVADYLALLDDVFSA